jgi:predicted enzyme related to lactoylglutathione lyase
MAVGTLGNVVLDCPDPQGLAEFYAAVIGGEVSADADGDWVDLKGAPGGVTVSFQRAPQLRAPKWPDLERPQQVHLDIDVADMDAGQEQVLKLGAKLLQDDDNGKRGFRVFEDPAGHPFCLCRQ